MEPVGEPVGKVVVAVDDMFFAAKILAAAEHAGREVERVKSTEELDAAIARGAPALLIVDLNSTRFDALAIVERLKAEPGLSAVPILGFLSHVQVELKRRAEAAGCDHVLPRSAFAQRLLEILAGSFL